MKTHVLSVLTMLAYLATAMAGEKNKSDVKAMMDAAMTEDAATLNGAMPTTKEAEALSKNAALIYWQAFALLPDLSDKEYVALSSLKNPTPEQKKLLPSILKRSHKTLDMLRVIGTIKDAHCDWGLLRYRGFDTLMPHLSKLRQCARLAVLRARLSDDPARATEDMQTAMRISEHCSNDFLISALVGLAVKDMVIDYLEEGAPTLDKAGRSKLVHELKAYDGSAHLRRSFEVERTVAMTTLKRIIDKVKTIESKDPKAVDGAVKIMSGYLKEFDAYYAELGKALELPPKAAAARAADLESTLKDTKNIYLAMVAPALSNIIKRFQKFQERVDALK